LNKKIKAQKQKYDRLKEIFSEQEDLVVFLIVTNFGEQRLR
jgi:hypothetical protein